MCLDSWRLHKLWALPLAKSEQQLSFTILSSDQLTYMYMHKNQFRMWVIPPLDQVHSREGCGSKHLLTKGLHRMLSIIFSVIIRCVIAQVYSGEYFEILLATIKGCDSQLQMKIKMLTIWWRHLIAKHHIKKVTTIEDFFSSFIFLWFLKNLSI